MDWQFEWGSGKQETILVNHEIDFVDVCELFGSEMPVRLDSRQDYGEERFIGMAPLDGRLMVVVFTHRCANVIRIISARKANHREQKAYYQARANELQEAGRDEGFRH